MRKLKRVAAFALALTVILSNAALADTVVLADRPFGQQTTGSGMSQPQTGGNGPGSNTQAAGTMGAAPGASGGSNAGPGQGAAAATDPNAGHTTGGPASTFTGKGGVATETQEIVIDAKIAQPVIASETAVLIEAATGQVLYQKDAEKAMYPASTTKLMTALLTIEKLGLDDRIRFSDSATGHLEDGAVTANMVSGDTMTVRDALAAMLLMSACEVANALGENVAGNEAAFASMMNEKAKALGCRNSNFRNASGLNDSGHYSCAYDLARIAAAAVSNEHIKNILGTKNYTLPASKKRGALAIKNSNKMIFVENPEYYTGIVGGKTGFTSKAGNTVVEIADISGHRLVAVAMKSQGQQFADAKKLFDYGKQLIGNEGAGITSPENQGKWEETAAGKKFKKPNGSYAKEEWVDIGENEYYFDANGIMATGWKKFSNGAWYYLDPDSGAMIHDKWVSTDGQKYYYLRSNGVMATNTVIGGTYRVDANGVYVEKVG